MTVVSEFTMSCHVIWCGWPFIILIKFFFLSSGAGDEATMWWKKVWNVVLIIIVCESDVSYLSFCYMICRDVYEYMVARYRERGRSKGGKGESFSLQQLQTARDEYDQEATLFVFRLKSLKQGQSRSLLTQAARHHAAQVFLTPSIPF